MLNPYQSCLGLINTFAITYNIIDSRILLLILMHIIFIAFTVANFKQTC